MLYISKDKILRLVRELEKSLTDHTDVGNMERTYNDIRSMCNAERIDPHLLDVAFLSFTQGRGSIFSKKYLRRFITHILERK